MEHQLEEVVDVEVLDVDLLRVAGDGDVRSRARADSPGWPKIMSIARSSSVRSATAGTIS
ncbi:MAG: hypothetical protein KatS3mg010_0614 [Acidimicrobiia bacterium]|nr:MAG: hypothetical protein KatS3mg010_0614 [Acidimicrobiia bacterium]